VLLLLLCLVQVAVEGVETLFPELFVARDPGRRVLKRRDLQAAAADAPVFARRDEAGPLQDVHVFQDGRQRHRERPRELGDGRVLFRELGQDGAPRRVGQGPEGRVEAGLIINHMVNYY
jgi:hypothetical protein